MSDYWQFPQDEASTPPPPPPPRSTPPPPPPPPQTWAPPTRLAPPYRLYRSRSHRLVGGVAGGIARHLGVDPLLIRFATVLVLMSGLGIFAYLAAWLVMPLEPAVGTPVGRRERSESASSNWPRSGVDQLKSVLAILAIAIALGIAFDSFTFLALSLIGGGIWLLSQQEKPVLAQAQQAMSAAVLDKPQQKLPLSEQDRQQWRRQYEWEAERYGWPDIGEPPVDVMVPAPARPRQIITRLVLSLLLLLIALATAAVAGDWWDVRPTRMLGIAIVTVGAGVALGAVFRNRARGLIPLGLLLCVAMIPASVVTNGAGGSVDVFSSGVGVRAVAPTTVAMLESNYELAIGELTVDLSKLDLAGESRTVDINVAAGELQVLLPPDIGGAVSIEISVGEVSVDLNGASGQRTHEGINIDTGTLPLDGTNGELFLKIKASVGDIQVRQAGS